MRLSIAQARALNIDVDRYLGAGAEVQPAPVEAPASPPPPPVVESPPGRWELTIPGFRPTLDNELKRNPLAAHSLKRRDADVIARAKLAYAVPDATRRRRLTLTIWNRFGSFPDDPAPLKSILDALVVNRLLVDDSRKWLELVYPPEYVRGPKQTIIVLEDLEP